MSAARNHAIVRQDERIASTLAALSATDDPAELDKLNAALNGQLMVRNALVNAEDAS